MGNTNRDSLYSLGCSPEFGINLVNVLFLSTSEHSGDKAEVYNIGPKRNGGLFWENGVVKIETGLLC